jgi:predicted secreted acid phosphatase
MFTRRFFIGCFLLLGSAFAFDVKVDNLASCKASLVEYIHSGAYSKDIEKKAKTALTYLQQEVALAQVNNLAVVFDIDETLLSNTTALEKYSFGGDEVVFDQITQAADATPIHPVINIYNWAKQHQMAVYLVTGRSELFEQATISNLNKAGIKNWDGLYFWPHNSKLNVQEFKSAMRKKIQTEGKVVVLNIGDQHSDLLGGNAQKSVKLPNPFYIIPSIKTRG